MVPINFYEYRAQIKKALLARKASLASEWDPFLAAWIAYGLSANGVENNIPLSDLATWMERWAADTGIWEFQRNLGPLAFFCWLQRQQGKPCDPEFIVKLSERVTALNADRKLSLLRDPEQAFLLALGLNSAQDARADDAKTHLIEAARHQATKGPLRRRILFAAAQRELGDSVEAPQGEIQDVGDIIALVWWVERYPGLLKRDEQWQRFASMVEMIALEDDELGETQRVLSVPELALAYEAVCKETSHPDPILLFEYLPLHPRVYDIARDHFRNGKYVTAVDQACKVLNELIQTKSGVLNKSEAELVQATMKQIRTPTALKIKFNKFLHDESGKDEQAGLALLCEGVFKAFRNPKGHKPEDHPLVQIEPYEALAQLVIISYLIERIEKAEGK